MTRVLAHRPQRAAALLALMESTQSGRADSVRSHNLYLRALLAEGRPLSPRYAPFVTQNLDALQRYGIRAWDLCRLIDTARSCRSAGYLSEDEAWAWIFRAARALRAWRAQRHRAPPFSRAATFCTAARARASI